MKTARQYPDHLMARLGEAVLNLTFEGKTQTVAEWEREMGLSSSTIHHRLRAGWTPARAIRTPSSRRSVA